MSTETTVLDATEDEVFNFIKANGATKAVIEFSGGEDSGGCDSIRLLDADDALVVELKEASWGMEYDSKLNKWVRQPLGNDEKVRIKLCNPVYDRYHSFAFEGHVYGQLVWNAEDRTVRMTGSESTYVYEGFDEDLTGEYGGNDNG